jgi:hypothetical protein
MNQSTDPVTATVGVKRKPDDDAQASTSISSDSVVKKPKKITAVRFVLLVAE